MEFQEYYQEGASIVEIIEELSDTELTLESDNERINLLCINLAVKYLAKYLRVDDTNPDNLYLELQKQVNGMIDKWSAEGTSSNSDNLAVECLSDVQTTAAILKEIIFNEDFQLGDEERFFGLNLGSGTGILSVALSVSYTHLRAQYRRSKKKSQQCEH